MAPDDAGVLERLLAPSDTERVLLFEAHRPWRERLGLSVVELPEVAARLGVEYRSRKRAA